MKEEKKISISGDTLLLLRQQYYAERDRLRKELQDVDRKLGICDMLEADFEKCIVKAKKK